MSDVEKRLLQDLEANLRNPAVDIADVIEMLPIIRKRLQVSEDVETVLKDITPGEWRCEPDKDYPEMYRIWAMKDGSGSCVGYTEREEDGKLAARAVDMADLLIAARDIVKHYSGASWVIEAIDECLRYGGLDV